MPTFSLEPDEEHIIESLKTDNDRTIAIVCGSILEARVEDKIKAQLRQPDHKDSKKILDDMFQGFGPLSSFSAQIRLGYLLGLYNYRVREELSAVKDIRNRFAHSKSPITFDMPEIAKLTNKLTLVEKHVRPISEFDKDAPPKEGIMYTVSPANSYFSPKWRFIATFGLYTRVFSMRLGTKLGPVWGDGQKP